MSSQWSPRAAAAKAVEGVIFHHRSLSATLPQATQSLEPSDRALAQEISYGVKHQQLKKQTKKKQKKTCKKN